MSGADDPSSIITTGTAIVGTVGLSLATTNTPRGGPVMTSEQIKAAFEYGEVDGYTGEKPATYQDETLRHAYQRGYTKSRAEKALHDDQAWLCRTK